MNQFWLGSGRLSRSAPRRLNSTSDGCEMFRWSLGFMVGWGLIQQWVPDGRNNVLEDGRLSFHTGSGVSWNIDGGLWVVWNPI